MQYEIKWGLVFAALQRYNKFNHHPRFAVRPSALEYIKGECKIILDIKIVKTEHPKQKPQDESKLGFGKIFSDHMFLMDYTAGDRKSVV